MPLQRVDGWTVAGWGLLLLPLLTMWHEIGGHAATCLAVGGHVAVVGAFYVDCAGTGGGARLAVAAAGVVVNVLLSAVAFGLWRRAKSDRARLAWWLVWISEAFVAAGYFLFSGVSGVGDLGTSAHGGFAQLPFPIAFRIAEIAVGLIAYIQLVRAGIRGLNAMIGTGPSTRPVRRRIAHVYYASAGVAAVMVGLLNPVGWFITIMSAAASSFGGLAGLISIGYATRGGDAPRRFEIPRDWRVIAGGVIATLAFAIVLGPSIKP